MALGLVFINPPPARAQQDAEAFYQQNCAACHTNGGGKLLGPDLKGVTKARDHEWLEKWLENPEKMLDSGDTTALKLKEEYNGIVMPTVPGMTPQMAESLLNFIAAKSGGPSEAAQASPAQEEPFTEKQVAEGRALFLGRQKLQSGTASSVSCHSVKSTGGALGGGQLGPDLTLVYQRLNGLKGLEAWLASPASAVMKPIFTKHPLKPEEISALTAGLPPYEPRGCQRGLGQHAGTDCRSLDLNHQEARAGPHCRVLAHSRHVDDQLCLGRAPGRTIPGRL